MTKYGRFGNNTQREELRTQYTGVDSSSRSSSTTTTRARDNGRNAAEGFDWWRGKDGVVLTDTDMDMLEEYYELNFGTPLPPVMARRFLQCAGVGMQTDVMCAAIDSTMLAPRPSAHYLLAILRRYTAEGVLTGIDLAADDAQHDADMAMRFRRRWATINHDEEEDSFLPR